MEDSPDDIRRELALARAALNRDARAAVVDARTLADWQHHFRAHPWLFSGCAAAIGFLLVPGRKRATTWRAAERAFERAEFRPNVEQPQAKSLSATALGLAASFLARQTLNVATRQGMKWLQTRAAQCQAAMADRHTMGDRLRTRESGP